MKAVAELATGLDLVRARSESVLDPDQLGDIDDIVERVGERRGFVGDTFVAALAGGTGAGKSSLINALAGSEVSSVSPVRPHTDQPVALVPDPPDPELIAFLDAMGIAERVATDRFSDLAVLDLPDQDSTALAHRQLVWDVLPEVDAIVWVTDPDKYNDTVFLRDYVSGLAAYQDQALFVLNKCDLLTPDELDELKADLVGHLEVAGIVRPTVFTVAAAPPHQEPAGTDVVVAHLQERMAAKRVIASKTIADVSRALSLLARRAHLDRGWAVDFDDRWDGARLAAEAALTDGDAGAAAEAIDGFVVSLVGDVGPSFGRKLVAAVGSAELERELTVAASQAASVPRTRRRRRRSIEQNSRPWLQADLDGTVREPLHELLWDRAYLGATLAAVAVQAAQAQERLSS